MASINAPQSAKNGEGYHIFALMIAVMGFTLAYMISYIFGLPKYIYLPIAHQFTLEPPEHVIKMGYYGLLLNASIGFAALYLLGLSFPIARWLGRIGRKAFAWALIGLNLFAVGYIAHHELSRWGGWF